MNKPIEELTLLELLREYERLDRITKRLALVELLLSDWQHNPDPELWALVFEDHRFDLSVNE